MDFSFEDLKQELIKKNTHLSYQRLKVLEFMYHNRSHPTVDDIFTELHKDISTLSKTTVYNTLKVLVDKGIIRVVSIDDNEARYDIEVDNHGHFKCEVCHKIFDFNIDMVNLGSQALQGFQINDKNVYFKGICPGCLLKIK